ncbi:beta-defensin 119 isoform X2 [Ictidomys tridecemlineatus]|uniref:Defensin beta 119 n=2 Tax=Marmotini TaxID=337730 RepID=A0A8C6ACA2_MARMA
MKLLLLFLAIFLAVEPVMSGRHSLLRCMGSMGVCRTACRKIEHTYFYCRNYQSCCLQSFMRINVAGKDEPGVLSYAKHWPKIP